VERVGARHARTWLPSRAHTEYSLEIAYEHQGNRGNQGNCVDRAVRRRKNMGSAIWGDMER